VEHRPAILEVTLYSINIYAGSKLSRVIGCDSIKDDAFYYLHGHFTVHFEALLEDKTDSLLALIPVLIVVISLELAKNEYHYFPLRKVVHDLQNLHNNLHSAHSWLSEHPPQVPDGRVVHLLLYQHCLLGIVCL
jgi:hypothetical protein